jgi:putative N-acetyltransferase (TIGR04045 family)
VFPASPGPFVPPRFTITIATEPWEVAAAMRLRHDVFCREQGLFAESDRDAADDIATTIVAVTYAMGMPDIVVGTVRIHATGPRTWVGSRLAIRAPFRGVVGLGAGLIYRAVSTANARGCDDFTATVQAQNVRFFRRLQWEALEPCVLHGVDHMRMRADLDAYPPLADVQDPAIGA